MTESPEGLAHRRDIVAGTNIAEIPSFPSGRISEKGWDKPRYSADINLIQYKHYSGPNSVNFSLFRRLGLIVKLK